MTEPKEKVRICDLKPGDEFIIWGREKRVASVNGVVRFVDTTTHKHGHATKIGAKSQQWVEILPAKEEVRHKPKRYTGVRVHNWKKIGVPGKQITESDNRW
jgi:hypothetical protein